ncbi:MAG: DUF2809 domain-containing protein [Flavobacteriaceae bacterium]|nr:DUF2809 domain-containing protein [Flavobacteriaceae bacterium]
MKKYGSIFILLLVTEIAIAIFHFHRFIRGFVGDVLVIPLLYALLRTLTKTSMIRALLLTLLIAVLVEIAQGFSLWESLGIQSKILQTLLGSTFDPWDLIAYLLGAFVILIFEKISRHETH